MTIASLLHHQYSLTQIAQQLKRSPSTISRELKRNTQHECFASQAATTCARQRRRSGRPAKKLHTEGILFGVVHYFLNKRWSPEQISLTLASIYPKGHELSVSTETIYNCIYAQPVGQLKKDLIQALRQSMTYDQGREMALHKELSHNTGIAVYFCDPHSP
jgi:IS30 family transposase